jgi:hypothetical protein
MRCPSTLGPVLLVALLVGACGSSKRVAAVRPEPRLAAIEVEVYDPVSNYVWENVGVRVVRAWHEWSGVTVENPDDEQWYLTNQNGLVLLDARALGEARVGFREDLYGRAMIDPEAHVDEADVWLEVWSPGFSSVFVQVPLSFRTPTRFVSVPFE